VIGIIFMVYFLFPEVQIHIPFFFSDFGWYGEGCPMKIKFKMISEKNLEHNDL